MKLIISTLALGAAFLSACGTTASSSERVPEADHAITAIEDSDTSSEAVELAPEFEPVRFSIPGDVAESSSEGQIDWSGNTVRATGTGVVDTRNTNRAQARLMAERAAVVVAQRNLLEAVKGVRVDSETRVENFMTDYDVIYTRVEGVVRNARQLGPAVYDSLSGTVEVELEMDIHGSQGLSGAISEALTGQGPVPVSMSDQTRDFLQQYSALVFDGSQAGLQPSMYPKIYDADGNLLIDTSQYASYLGAGGQTAMQFISDLDALLSQPAFSGSPLVVNVRQITGQLGTDIVLGREESDALGWLKTGLPFLMGAGKFLLSVI
ncbi:MAG: hypothetical protein JXA64_01465 [Candidatus Fermentibacteraceae bacterium]|nr:hypothetical protein [Candidatus Fermentibacteraceae bacterium]MBN2607755.1 hypothetical protein [Candidatus Fermentibacteraceae bacterium]